MQRGPWTFPLKVIFGEVETLVSTPKVIAEGARYTRLSDRGGSSKMRYGVNGNPLREGKLDLPELLQEPTLEERAWARDFIAQRSWREAVTYRETAPHEYVVCAWETHKHGSRDFNHFITLIRRFGFADFYYQLRHIYWAIDEFKYWTMGWGVEETAVINRARVDAPEPWKES